MKADRDRRLSLVQSGAANIARILSAGIKSNDCTNMEKGILLLISKTDNTTTSLTSQHGFNASRDLRPQKHESIGLGSFCVHPPQALSA